MSVIAIAAVDKNMGIGKDGGIPWKSDLGFFKKITTNHIVIMGRKTWDSLKVQPLPDRINIVVSTSLADGRWKLSKDSYDMFYTVKSVGQALSLAREYYSDKEAFLIGGERLYQSAFIAGVVDAVLLTRYALDANCDTFFPQSIKQLEESYKRWKTFEINNDGDIPLMRTYYQ